MNVSGKKCFTYKVQSQTQVAIPTREKFAKLYASVCSHHNLVCSLDDMNILYNYIFSNDKYTSFYSKHPVDTILAAIENLPEIVKNAERKEQLAEQERRLFEQYEVFEELTKRNEKNKELQKLEKNFSSLDI